MHVDERIDVESGSWMVDWQLGARVVNGNWSAGQAMNADASSRRSDLRFCGKPDYIFVGELKPVNNFFFTFVSTVSMSGLHMLNL